MTERKSKKVDEPKADDRELSTEELDQVSGGGHNSTATPGQNTAGSPPTPLGSGPDNL